MIDNKLLAMFSAFAEEARRQGQHLVVSAIPRGRQVKLLCQSCGAVLARNVQGAGIVSHRCTNKSCPASSPDAELVQHLFVSPE